jgi:hypothetical protein
VSIAIIAGIAKIFRPRAFNWASHPILAVLAISRIALWVGLRSVRIGTV